MVASSNSNAPPLSFGRTFAASAIAACTAETMTLPLDTAKVRLQLQQSGNKYKGLFGTMATIAKEEGPKSLWAGLEPGLHRQCLFGGLRIGMYEPVRNFYVGKDFKGDPPLHLKIAAGLTTGALGIMVASPTDLVKVRMQAEGKLPAGTPKKYPSAFNAYPTIIREEGVASLWKGVSPNIARNALINAAELASYDQVKESLLATGLFKDDVFTQLLSGLGAGFIAVCVGSPVDVVKSRIMSDNTGRYSGVLDCFAKTARTEGLPAFYRGFIPNFGRLGSWNVAMFLTLEQVKKLMTPQQ
ncbi:mitochondrial carrier domain-containing protein [Dunaliella salina]|uniref:Mitochondrial carrier domain-containing protein n=1 Tax=Dunaliella salina TaxID=3046 RepID=A0ABQ7FYU8_DUNSA|nr:mitochondrial carrier domain-containing protein [Dunaliella salina]|eukprot:KAF5827525.1 mitochondrial carrier domain-containing protein [Dunaliella salina]